MATNDLSNNLAKARNSLGLTQQQVADKIGVTLQAYQNYEYGRRDIKGSVLARLSKALSCSVNYILGLDEKAATLGCSTSDIAGIDQSGMTADEREMLDIYSRLSMSDKSVLMRVARALGS